MTVMIVIAFVVCSIAALLLAVSGRREKNLRQVDLKAFRTLMDRDDELFLRENLSRSRFLQLKRQRVLVAFKYVSRIASNAATVMRLSGPARASENADVAQTAVQITELATQIRLQCLMAFAKLSLEFAFPSLQLSPAVLAPKYQALRENVLRLGSLQEMSVASVTAI